MLGVFLVQATASYQLPVEWLEANCGRIEWLDARSLALAGRCLRLVECRRGLADAAGFDGRALQD